MEENRRRQYEGICAIDAIVNCRLAALVCVYTCLYLFPPPVDY